MRTKTVELNMPRLTQENLLRRVLDLLRRIQVFGQKTIKAGIQSIKRKWKISRQKIYKKQKKVMRVLKCIGFSGLCIDNLPVDSKPFLI